MNHDEQLAPYSEIGFRMLSDHGHIRPIRVIFSIRHVPTLSLFISPLLIKRFMFLEKEQIEENLERKP